MCQVYSWVYDSDGSVNTLETVQIVLNRRLMSLPPNATNKPNIIWGHTE